MNIQSFVQRYPNLYHMAEVNTWDSIRQNGLLSTSAILDYHGINGQERDKYESLHRPSMMSLASENHQLMILRDQIPMPPSLIAKALGNGITPNEWYFFLNQKVFFWATRERLMRLVNGKQYRNIEHDVLTIDTSSFVQNHLARISICHMNSGNTRPYPHARDYSIFVNIADYPMKANGNPVKEVAEVTIDYSVPDIYNYTVKVERMRGNNIPTIIYEK